MFGPAGVELRRPLGRRPAGFPSSGSVIRVLRQATSGLDHLSMSAPSVRPSARGLLLRRRTYATSPPPQHLFVHADASGTAKRSPTCSTSARLIPLALPFTAIRCWRVHLLDGACACVTSYAGENRQSRLRQEKGEILGVVVADRGRDIECHPAKHFLSCVGAQPELVDEQEQLCVVVSTDLSEIHLVQRAQGLGVDLSAIVGPVKASRMKCARPPSSRRRHSVISIPAASAMR